MFLTVFFLFFFCSKFTAVRLENDSSAVAADSSVNINVNNNNNEQMSSDEIFQFPIQFMDSLVDVSRHLTTVPSDQYRTELQKQLEKQDAYLQGLPKTGAGT